MSTCPLLTKLTGLPSRADLVVQYLHSFPRVNPLDGSVCEQGEDRFSRFIFVTAYKQYHSLMADAGLSPFIPRVHY